MSDWETDEGIMRQAEALGMGIVLMRPLTSGVFQRLMAEAWVAGWRINALWRSRSTLLRHPLAGL